MLLSSSTLFTENINSSERGKIMVLKTIEENQAWLRMTWQCAFPMQWPNILFAVRALVPTFDMAEVKVGESNAGGETIDPNSRPEEKSLLILQGDSKHFKGKVSIQFFTRTNKVVVLMSKKTGFRNDYQYLSEAVGPFMDTVELRMYAGK